MNRKISIRFRCEPRSGLGVLLTLMVLVAVFLAALLLKPQQAGAAQLETVSAVNPHIMRQFYLTKEGYDGDSVKTACAGGYHMASLWEIWDPSNLKYNPSLGLTADDSGQGPPSETSAAWVRTGYGSEAGQLDHPGEANCNAWTSAEITDWGTYVILNEEWDQPADMYVWDAVIGSCTNTLHVWCVADYAYYSLYLPQVVSE